MARYQHLPIYNSLFKLLNEFYLRVPKMDKQYKYTLGASLIQNAMEAIRLIVRANSVSMQERIILLDELVWKIEEININLRMTEKLKQFDSDRQYLYLVEQVVDCVRQAEGWRTACSFKTAPAQNRMNASFF